MVRLGPHIRFRLTRRTNTESAYIGLMQASSLLCSVYWLGLHPGRLVYAQPTFDPDQQTNSDVLTTKQR